MQVLPCLVPHSITLIVLPLLALGFEQEEKIRSLLDSREESGRVAVNTMNAELIGSWVGYT